MVVAPLALAATRVNCGSSRTVAVGRKLLCGLLRPCAC